jgi:2-dehydropantoate 2-reductase
MIAPVKIAVVGAGAMGSVYAGLLAGAGHEVWAVDSWQEHVDAIRERGLRVEGASGDRVVRVRATTHAAEVGPAELVVIATKAMNV